MHNLKRNFMNSLPPPEIDITLTNGDLNYIFLIYCCTNNCILSDRWSHTSAKQLYNIVFSNPHFTDLIRELEITFQFPFSDSSIFQTMIFHFYKKCLLNLQCIISEKQFYLDLKKDPLTISVIQQISEVLSSWRINHQLPYPIDKEHIYYLTSQLMILMQSYMPAVEVIILSDLTSELNIWELFVKRKFSSKRVHIRAVLLNASNLDFLSILENSVIITKKTFIPFLLSLNIPKNNLLLPFSAEINSVEREMLSNAVNKCEKTLFSTLLTKINSI